MSFHVNKELNKDIMRKKVGKTGCLFWNVEIEWYNVKNKIYENTKKRNRKRLHDFYCNK